MDYVIDNNGAFTLGIVNPDLEIGHALTLWGYEIVDDEIIGSQQFIKKKRIIYFDKKI